MLRYMLVVKSSSWGAFCRPRHNLHWAKLPSSLSYHRAFCKSVIYLPSVGLCCRIPLGSTPSRDPLRKAWNPFWKSVERKKGPKATRSGVAVLILKTSPIHLVCEWRGRIPLTLDWIHFSHLMVPSCYLHTWKSPCPCVTKSFSYSTSMF